MNQVQKEGGTIVSCTTDGFITNLPDLDKNPAYGDGPLAKYLSFCREALSGDPHILEKKHETTGIAS